MEAQLPIGELKTYSRKELVAWVESSSAYKFKDLKNGLFFLRILKKLVPTELSRQKVYQKPKNNYEFTQNLNIMKKILNKFGHQLNLNVLEVVESKNCFELASWFKNLYDHNKEDNDEEFAYSQKSFTPSKLGATTYRSPASKLPRATSSNIRREDRFRTLAQPADKLALLSRPDDQYARKSHKSKNSIALQKLSLESFDEHNLSAYSSGSKLKSRKEGVSLAYKKKQALFMNKTSAKLAFKQNDAESESGDSENDIQELLKKEALQGSIRTFQKILQQIRSYVTNLPNETTPEDLQQKIQSIIYMK